MKLAMLALACALGCAAPARRPILNLETLDGPTAVKLMDEGKLTSVELTRAYIARIAALNKSGPGLNAVTQLNDDALKDAALLDKERREGHVRGPAHGLPILLKDLIDVKGMYTSAGNYSLRNSFPAIDSGVAKKLRENGVVILGKLGLSEYANFFGNQPSGFSNLTGQVLNAVDADQNPSGSSSGTGSAGAAALSMLIDRHRDLRLDHLALAGQRPRRPAADGRPRARLRHRADLGLAGHRRPDGPHGRQRGDDAAVDRRPRPPQRGLLPRDLGPGHRRLGHHPARPGDGPELHVRARPELRARQADRLERHLDQVNQAKAALEAAGAILVERPVISPAGIRRLDPQLRGPPRHRPLLPPPRPGRADQVAGRRRTPTTWPTSTRR